MHLEWARSVATARRAALQIAPELELRYLHTYQDLLNLLPTYLPTLSHTIAVEATVCAMRPPRIAILALFFAASLFLFCRSIATIRRSAPVTTTPASTTRSHFRSLFSFTPPFSLFPPNAAISLTDDNSTFFPARPAAFGPPLSPKGLSGPLWIGSGFAEDNLQGAENRGELGCSDVPGWDEAAVILGIKVAQAKGSKSKVSTVKSKASKRDSGKGPLLDRVKQDKAHDKKKPIDDGTDDYLQQGLRSVPQSAHDGSSSTSSHADIQSIQETAEITGKVALLKRGGCGFLEKVKWAQRRGAIAVIVGDNTKGGPLIQMFARGDTSNVTIPAIFTAHTTAHLLSSLLQPGSFIEDIIDDNGKPVLKVQSLDKGSNKKTNPTTSTVVPKVTTAPKRQDQLLESTGHQKSGPTTSAVQPRGFLSTILRWAMPGSSSAPSSRGSDWVMVGDWNDEKDKMLKSSIEKASKKGPKAAQDKADAGDGFQIGIQDWRDPGLREPSSDRPVNSNAIGKNGATSTDASSKTGKANDGNMPKGGSNTPGSGEYTGRDKSTSTIISGEHSQDGVSSKISGNGDGDDSILRPVPAHPEAEHNSLPEQGHEGLWVTITPTSSASPFFDTLLVLVISPLITLSVVYALLILRAKIRRRRWRAPKSVVERLPVRTYHTVAVASSVTSRLPSPTSSSPTTPLLQGSTSRPRPRSRTTSGIPDAADLLRLDTGSSTPQPQQPREEHEKEHGNMPSQWKKYMGRQVECVVCLEEYVDGVSRVMSLPCGHEFHAECM